MWREIPVQWKEIPQVKLAARQVDISKTKDKPYKLSDGGGLYHRLMRVSWNALLSANDT